MNIIEEKYDWAKPLTPRKKTTLLVIHHEAGSGNTAQQIHQYHRYHNGWSGIAYHYYVRKDGSIYRGRPENMVGGHCYGYNSISIGICFEGNFCDEKMNAVQLKAGQELVADIKRRYPGIDIKRHKDLNATACPGTYFPFTELISGAPEVIKEVDFMDDLNRFKDMWLQMRKELQDNDAMSYSADARAWAVNNGLIKGGSPLPDGAPNYMWEDVLTREQMVTLLYRFSQLMKAGKE